MLKSEVMTAESLLLWEAFKKKSEGYIGLGWKPVEEKSLSVFLSLLVGCWRGMNEIWRCTAVYQPYHSLVKISMKKQMAHLLDWIIVTYLQDQNSSLHIKSLQQVLLG